MILAISQPTLYPWIGFFDIIEKSDIFVFLDDVQFNRHGWQQNNRIKDPKSDEEVWLNIPIKKASLENNINETKIDNSKKENEIPQNSNMTEIEMVRYYQYPNKVKEVRNAVKKYGSSYGLFFTNTIENWADKASTLTRVQITEDDGDKRVINVPTRTYFRQ